MGLADTLMKVGTATHAALYKLLGGRFMGAGDEGSGGVIVVTTTGRKSGKRRSRPLMHMRDGENLVVIGSAGGSDQHPAGYLNMLENPVVTVHRGESEATYTARTADGDERDTLFGRFRDHDARFGEYEQRTDRVIPVVVLEPSD